MSVTSVTLGNFFTLSNGKTVLGGAGGSGLDTQSLIKSLAASKQIPATNDQDQITLNDKQSTALSSFQSLLSAFQSSADALRNPPGVGNAANNVFKFTTGNVGNGGSSYVSINTSPGSALQTYSISNISQLATAAQQGTGTFTITNADAAIVSANPISGTPYQFKPGSFVLGGQTITVNEGDSLNAVAADINAASTSSGITATVVQLQAGQYQLTFTSTKTGTANNFDLNKLATLSDPSGVFSNIGLTEQQSTSTLTVASATADATVGPASFTPGTLTFTGGATVTVNAGDSLNTIASSFNAVSASTGIGAQVVQVAANQFKLAFTATQAASGTPFDLTQVGTVSDPSGVFSNVGLSATKNGVSVVAGQDAKFNINGIPITRSSNTVSDVVNGVTFNLLQKTPDAVTTYPAVVQPDTTTIQNAIVSFVNAYNAVKTFAAQQTQLNADGTPATGAVLYNNQTFLQTMSNLNTQLNSQVAGLVSTDPQSLVDLGITFTNQPASGTNPEVDNILTVNDGKLSSALASNFQGVSNVFGLKLTSNNPNFTIFKDSNSLSVTGLTLNLNPGANTFTATYNAGNGPVTVNLTATALTGGTTGYTLTGPSGSAIDGVQFIYASSSTATINATITQGIGEKIYNSTQASNAANTGTIALALKALKDSDTQLNKDITTINAQVAVYKQQLVDQFTALETAISRSNTLLQSLNANANAQLTSSGH